MIKKAAMERCRTCYILADSSKIGQIAPVTFAKFDQAKLITTELTDKDLEKGKKYCRGESMIYTVTFNPSLDYVIQVDDLTLGEVNRTTSEKFIRVKGQ
mgnify:CR=1 FL=1